MDFVAAVLGVPLAFFATCLGVGLLIDRVSGSRLPGELLAPVGFCGSTVITLAVFTVHLHGGPALAALLIATGAGLLLGRGRIGPGRDARSRRGMTAAAAATVATYLLFIAPELASGGWTWAGYNFVNDTSIHFLLVDHLQHFGTALGPLPRSGAREALGVLASGYPLGTHAQLAALSELLGAHPEVLYQGYIASLAAVTALTLTWLARRVGIGPWAAAAIGFVAASANLTYQYALQGSIKEMGALAAVAASAAVACEIISSDRPVRLAPALAVGLAGILAVYSAAGAPYALLMLVMLAAASIGRRPLRATRPRRGWRQLQVPLIAGAGALLLAIPALSTISTLYRTAERTFSGPNGSAAALGQLARPLQVSQGAGVWLSGDYRLPIPHQPAATLTAIAIAVVLAGLGLTLLRALVTRERWTDLLVVAPPLLVLAILGSRLTPYGVAKLLAIAGPFVVWGGARGLIWLGRARPRRAVGVHWPAALRWRSGLGLARLPVTLAVAVGLAVLVSDALAYHHDKLAPAGRMQALADVAKHAHTQSLVLFTEYEEFARYFARSVPVNTQSDTLAPYPVQLRKPQRTFGFSFDLDLDRLDYVESFPYLVLRRSPAASRPPANFSLVYRNRYYEIWRRDAQPSILAHLPLQGLDTAVASAPCAQVRRLAAAARPGDRLVAAVPAPVVQFHPEQARDRSYGWQPNPAVPGTVLTIDPGQARGTVDVARSGTYAAWVRGDFPRRVLASIDGRTVGQVYGVNTPGQWLQAGSVALSSGSHPVELRRPGGGLRPGDGADETIGPLALQLQTPATLQWLAVDRWRSLCGRALDWIETVHR
ncbi:MAG: hypothetical protein E6G56_09715 [Actinobacteria bacterium]|nr:MAG: hypothetical protein E6G56_09715 [Actinomycetota bacterium]